MKILFVTEYYPSSLQTDVRGGVEMRTFELSQRLAANHAVTVLAARQAQTTERAMVGNVDVSRPGPVAQYRQGGGLLTRARAARAMRQQVAGLNPDLIFVENFFGYIVALMLPAAWRKKCIVTYHDVWVGEWFRHMGPVLGLVGEIIERKMFRGAWFHFFANSRATKEKMVGAGVAEAAIDVVPNGIQAARCRELEAEQFAHPTIVSVARFVSYKRLSDLIRALPIVRLRVPDCRLVLIGSGPEEASYRSLIRDLGLQGAVEIRGFVPDHRNVLKAIKGATVFSLPSAVEGFGIVTLEAMACGTPYVNTDLAPTREITNNGVGGRLYPVGQVEQLAAGLVEILQQPALRQSLAEAGRRQAELYDWSAAAAQIERFIGAPVAA